MMSKRDYEMIADRLRSEYESAMERDRERGGGSARAVTVYMVASRLAAMFNAYNARFDYEKFMVATGTRDYLESNAYTAREMFDNTDSD